VVGEVHGLLMLSFVLLILGFMLATAISAYRLSRRRRRDMQAAGSAA
jgi:cbb3-type cytochrome oxidase subunit 3